MVETVGISVTNTLVSLNLTGVACIIYIYFFKDVMILILLGERLVFRKDGQLRYALISGEQTSFRFGDDVFLFEMGKERTSESRFG